MLGSENAGVREATALALGSLELDPTVIRLALATALRDEKPEVRRAAMKAIGRLGPGGAIFIPDLILLAEKKENQRSVERGAAAVRKFGPGRSVGARTDQAARPRSSCRAIAGDQISGARRPKGQASDSRPGPIE